MFSTHSTPFQGTFGKGVVAVPAACLLALMLAGCSRGPDARPVASAHVAVRSAPVAAPAHAIADVDPLLAKARRAYADHKVVAPAGDNAMEYYEAALAKDPGNAVARDALREIFPYGVPFVEVAISQGNYDEAEREIGVLAKADPENNTVTLLRSMLAANGGRAPQAAAVDGGTALAADAFRSGDRSLVLKASADSWVQVASTDGRRTDSRILRAGESRSYRSNGALRVTLGNAAAIAVVADGRTIPVNAPRYSRVAHVVLFARDAAPSRIASVAAGSDGKIAL